MGEQHVSVGSDTPHPVGVEAQCHQIFSTPTDVHAVGPTAP